MSAGCQFQRLVSLSSHSFRRAGERFEAKKKKRDNKGRKKERQIKVLDKIQTFFSLLLLFFLFWAGKDKKKPKKYFILLPFSVFVAFCCQLINSLDLNLYKFEARSILAPTSFRIRSSYFFLTSPVSPPQTLARTNLQSKL